ncbi:diphthine synthase [Candidatus Pacearchaeota archaeon CG09_land_8_20_14_0_10_30_9]|nr:diphthine synthase [Candidatus Pacearchaeota archaeon]OIO40597.1 MAG: diphthine synthase [Candidatus Pacearchaeota archaeon CG1_02_30_18]PIN71107.1 MAG: diphthine synthase [Candidatus Pacearchaeota archaeon CG11_big_fil_rev_8_21_14_0_20_30_13]PIO01161.1 MAG: diphthine synthase [Candidatus Pacearchaeota archaeon CG09_land_8_20_14_0_10_30_9]PIZ81698.1 MAG: diphthine synthase [Candidatus Pacearchaeota archaeon CG_4_10_14_0_2_um_filter_30_11]PJA71288.1 MAG: diphthine synthase [Candidatus Pacear
MLYLIGLGLSERGISKEGLDAIEKCKKIYLENYTVDFPYTEHQLEEMIGKKFKVLNRAQVENLSIIDEAEKLNVALLIYGSPLSATTHITIINECRESGIKYKVVYSASIFDAVAETGLQLYKFGKVSSMPAWQKSFEPDSFMEIVKQNLSIEAHSLILIDIGLEFNKALNQLKIAAKKHEIQLGKIAVCQALGTKNRKIMYRTIEEALEYSGVLKPYCIIIPGKLHFLEKEILEGFSKRKD